MEEALKRKGVNKMKMKTSETLIGAKTHFGSRIPIYDDHIGNSLYIMRDSMGIVGIVRTHFWENAYVICEDEFMQEANESIEELEKEFSTEKYPDMLENPCFQEGYGFRPNGPRKDDVRKHGIYAKDLNGEILDPLTDELIKKLEITLEIKKEKEKEEEEKEKEEENDDETL
jgi:hypothetical protein